MNGNNEMNMDEITLTEMLKELFEHQKQVQSFMEVQRDMIYRQQLIIEENGRQYDQLAADLEAKLRGILSSTVKVDIKPLMDGLEKGLGMIKETVPASSQPVTRQYRFTFFPDQIRQPEYYKIMVLGFLGFVLLVLSYLLLNKHI